MSSVADIAEIEVMGTVLALEYKIGERSSYYSSFREQLIPFFTNRGVLLRPLGNRIHIVPPYCITEQELQTVYEVIEESVLSLKQGADYEKK